MNEDDQQLLLKLAREAILTQLKKTEPNINDYMHLDMKKGVFVTLHKRGELRGCIGYPEPIMPLYKAVIDASRKAAFLDPRFPILTPDEMREIKIEISILTEAEPIEVDDPKEYSKEIKIGEDGLILHGEFASGLLLPQVAEENNFTVPQFLNALCQKAGLSFNAWENLDNKIEKFQAEVFSE